MASEAGRPGANSVTAADFVRSFAKQRREAERAPVMVTNHGAPTHVLLSIEAYDKLASQGSGATGAGEQEIIDDCIARLADASSEAMIVCATDLTCVHLNPVAMSHFATSGADCSGRPILEAIPQFAGTLIEHQVKRTAVSSEPTHADFPSPADPSKWLHLRTYVYRNRVLIGLRDITEEVQKHRLADVKSLLLDMMDRHGGIGYARLSVRGTIERATEGLASLVGIPVDRLEGVSFANLVDTADRAAFRERLEKILRGEGGGRTKRTLSLIGDGTSKRTVELVAEQIRGTFGSEGALVVFTHRSQ